MPGLAFKASWGSPQAAVPPSQPPPQLMGLGGEAPHAALLLSLGCGVSVGCHSILWDIPPSCAVSDATPSWLPCPVRPRFPPQTMLLMGNLCASLLSPDGSVPPVLQGRGTSVAPLRCPLVALECCRGLGTWLSAWRCCPESGAGRAGCIGPGTGLGEP